MDRQYGFHAVEERVVGIDRFQIDGNQTGLPIMEMNDSRSEVKLTRCLQHRPTEKGKPLIIVGEVLFSVMMKIETAAVEVMGIADETYLQPASAITRHAGGHNLFGCADRYLERPGQRLQVIVGGVKKAVMGDHDEHIVTRPRQLGRQSAHHVAETAGLGERHHLRGGY